MVKFFRCQHCGNIVTKVVDGSVPVVCCGEPMHELKANSSDGAGEKHVPVIAVEGNEVVVSVSTVEHPSLDNHYIQFIAIETTKGGMIRHLNPGDQPQARFALTNDEVLVAAYEYCNLHGLWMSAAK